MVPHRLACLAALGAWLAAGPAKAEPPGATLTAWGKHGGNKWSVCAERVLEAQRALPTFTDRAQSLGAEHTWAQRAEECPHAVPVLVIAARKESLHLVRLPDALDAGVSLDEAREELERSRERALAWFDEAEAEARRRGEATPPQLDFWRARVAMSLGRLDLARAATARARARGDVSEVQMRRFEALLALYGGDLEMAQVAAREAYVRAPLQSRDNRNADERLLASVVYALVLDRAGDDEGSRRLLYRAHANDRSALILQRLETYLPLHERVYFLALRSSLGGDSDRKIAVKLFRAYAQMEAVEAPERRLAERHIARLEQKPGRLGG